MGQFDLRGRVLVRVAARSPSSWRRRALATPARALDTDIFTRHAGRPNVLVVFDNSGSMGLRAYQHVPEHDLHRYVRVGDRLLALREQERRVGR